MLIDIVTISFKQRMAEATKLLRKAIEKGNILPGNLKALKTAKRNERRWIKAAHEEENHLRVIKNSSVPEVELPNG